MNKIIITLTNLVTTQFYSIPIINYSVSVN